MEKIKTKDYNNGLETKDSLSKVKAIDVAGNDILVSSGIVTNSGGGCRRYLSNNRLRYNNGIELRLLLVELILIVFF